MSTSRLILRFRIVLGAFMLGLVLSGVTAFPLLWEVDLLASWLGIGPHADPGTLAGLQYWIAHVREGLHRSYDAYPFLAYGTDWLAFAHIVIAVFFIGPMREPTAHDSVLISGIVACIGVLPLALICGPIREIPLYWRLIDCSFGVVGVVPLLYCLSVSRRLKHIAAPNRSLRGPGV
jgi:hypothetical protein